MMMMIKSVLLMALIGATLAGPSLRSKRDDGSSSDGSDGFPVVESDAKFEGSGDVEASGAEAENTQEPKFEEEEELKEEHHDHSEHTMTEEETVKEEPAQPETPVIVVEHPQEVKEESTTEPAPMTTTTHANSGATSLTTAAFAVFSLVCLVL
ncbi:unnamed protein product [Caenorhabditis bovis]|uniref:Uncharacterized protein n=1 Tax=Caenorhabditis bovis TaxID=2654633 RepID=A0A8S1FE40_9PELO|nr:unnamed protein product [Caenorhabditis bovis]